MSPALAVIVAFFAGFFVGGLTAYREGWRAALERPIHPHDGGDIEKAEP